MAHKILKYSEEVRRDLLEGVSALSKAVRATLGPKGRNVLLNRSYGPPVITKDGVTVARDKELKDPFQNMGAQMVKEVANRTSNTAGDGTTTATVLAEAIFSEGMRNITAGANPMSLKRGIDIAVVEVVKGLQDMSNPITDPKEVEQIATISANSDK
jgi:chaperonin GroEL